ncbi:hypothetical protein GCM10009412_37890 [Aeromonas salmonicida subsp. achromogenes]
MQGQGMAGERRPVYPAWIHWMGGDNGVMGGSNETPRTGHNAVHLREFELQPT